MAVVERGALQGRAQEWNISRRELGELVEQGVLSHEEAEAAVAVEFNPVRAGFHGGSDVWTRDVLNLGVRPAALVDAARRRFEAAGGAVLDEAAGRAAPAGDGSAAARRKRSDTLVVSAFGDGLARLSASTAGLGRGAAVRADSQCR